MYSCALQGHPELLAPASVHYYASTPSYNLTTWYQRTIYAQFTYDLVLQAISALRKLDCLVNSFRRAMANVNATTAGPRADINNLNATSSQ